MPADFFVSTNISRKVMFSDALCVFVIFILSLYLNVIVVILLLSLCCGLALYVYLSCQSHLLGLRIYGTVYTLRHAQIFVLYKGAIQALRPFVTIWS